MGVWDDSDPNGYGYSDQIKVDLARFLAAKPEPRKGIGAQPCSCGTWFDDEFERDREHWHAIHAEARRRAGDDSYHALEPF